MLYKHKTYVVNFLSTLNLLNEYIYKIANIIII